MKSIIISALIIISVKANIHAQAKRDCQVTFKVSGERNDGKGNYETELNVTQRCYDFDKAGLDKQLKDDKWRYGEHDYQFMSNPTMKQDCAGYTFEKIFNKGKFWITAGEFHDKLLLFFGRQIRSLTDPFGWGDVRKGDVLVYRKGGAVNHITYVSEVNTTLGVVTSVVIETKDGKEGTYKHKIGLMNDQTDPLIRAMGEIWVYRLDLSKLQVTEQSRTCDCDLMNIKGPGWLLESLVIDPDKKTGKWAENFEVTVSGNSVIAAIKQSKLSLTFTSPPKFIKLNEKAKFEVTGNYEGEDDNVWLKFTFMAQEGLEEKPLSVNKYGVLELADVGVGKFTMNHKEPFRNKTGTFLAGTLTNTIVDHKTAVIAPLFFVHPYNNGYRIFEAKYKRVN